MKQNVSINGIDKKHVVFQTVRYNNYLKSPVFHGNDVQTTYSIHALYIT